MKKGFIGLILAGAMLFSSTLIFSASAAESNEVATSAYASAASKLAVKVDFESKSDIGGESAESLTFTSGISFENGTATCSPSDGGFQIGMNVKNGDCAKMLENGGFTVYTKIKMSAANSVGSWQSLYRISDSEYRTFLKDKSNELNVRVKGGADFWSNTNLTGLSLAGGSEVILAQSYKYADGNVVSSVYVSSDNGKSFSTATSQLVAASALFGTVPENGTVTLSVCPDKIGGAPSYTFSDFRIYNDALTADEIQSVQALEDTVANGVVSFSENFVGQLRLIEPWGLKVSTSALIDGEAFTQAHYDAVKSAGFYFYEGDTDDAATVKTGKYVKVSEYTAIDGKLYMSGAMNGIYTKDLDKTVTVVAVITLNNGTTVTSAIKKIVPLDFITSLKDNENVSAAERAVYKAMYDMHVTYKAYLAELEA